VEARYASLLKLFDRCRSVIGEERRRESPTEIGRNIDTLLEQVETFRQSVSKIKKISNELELLGVNATIQAAHAGEQGKGFLIVADEISKLSGHSRQSVEEALQQLRLFTEITRSLSEDFSQSVVYIEKNLERFDALEALVQEHLPKEDRETSDRM
jgi:methyl-accepting chemotaxis protein